MTLKVTRWPADGYGPAGAAWTFGEIEIARAQACGDNLWELRYRHKCDSEYELGEFKDERAWFPDFAGCEFRVQLLTQQGLD